MNIKSVSLVLITVLIVLAGVFSVNASLKYMDTPNICSNCHAMEPFYESYSNPDDYPLIKIHKNEGIICIDCHSPPGRENRDKVRKTILKKIVSYVYTGNVTADTSLLKVDCIKCHDLDTTLSATEINPHAGVQSCEVSCHLAHENLKLGDFVERNCADCHVKPDLSGRHANVDCVGCHPTHGRIPSCTGCHALHDGSNVKVENSECLECHGESAHTIVVGIYDASSTIPKSTCGLCHEEQYNKLENSMHGTVGSCVLCHPSHGAVQECAKCHGKSYINYPGLDHLHIYHDFLLNDRRCSSCHIKSIGNLPSGCTNCHIQDPHTI
ncbi:MAG: NapC/NirT family cytochrome c [Methanosarcinaceae archaeon]|nr:NapC/NirT family cytochrome c [Methanosarcinaceae archaeon]